jgi:cyclopropane-fatty-acyl-phospholipid synthase
VPLLRIIYDRMRPLPGAARHVRSLPRWHGEDGVSVAGSRSNVYHHYDIGNDFYRLWLDEQLLYTCAYYARPELTLEQAQVAKMDHVCRKLGLRPGETVVEAGCGWGALALHMAREYGVSVRAYNVSREQIAYARERARVEGLDGRVEFLEEDWRRISGRCDAFVSVGMLEHVGVDNYRELGDVIHRVLPPHGRGLIHTIGRNYPGQLYAWIRHRIFPGAQPPALSQMMDVFEHRDFSVLDVENIRLHYAVTLKHWLERFESHADEVCDLFDERFVRMWRLYLASSMVAFESGSLQLYQVLFAPGCNTRLPWTRDGIYRENGCEEPGQVWSQLKLRAE